MSKTTVRRTVLSVTEGEKITRVNISEDGTSVEIFSILNYQEKTNPEEVKGTHEYIEKYFPIVEASTLSLEDEFITHEPESDAQRKFKERLISAIKSGLSDFRAQAMDTSFDENGDICYKAGMTPAVGKSAKWWNKTAKEFLPEKESRQGTNPERWAFLGLLIRYLIEEKGYSVSDAWKAVCDQSKDLGHYLDSKEAKHTFEVTGSRQVGKWYDLGNTFKITANDTEASGFSLVGGYCNYDGNGYPLADVVSISNPNNVFNVSVGWLVLSV